MTFWDWVGAIVGGMIGAMVVNVVWAVNAKADVRSACQSDYMTYCSHTEPFSSTCRACMRAIGRRGGLSSGCITALKTAGEVSAADKAAYKTR